MNAELQTAVVETPETIAARYAPIIATQTRYRRVLAAYGGLLKAKAAPSPSAFLEFVHTMRDMRECYPGYAVQAYLHGFSPFTVEHALARQVHTLLEAQTAADGAAAEEEGL